MIAKKCKMIRSLFFSDVLMDVAVVGSKVPRDFKIRRLRTYEVRLDERCPLFVTLS